MDPEPDVRSCVYTGWVRHRRFEPVQHAFRYRIAQPMLDLDELDKIFQRRWFWSVDRPNWASFHRRDHLGDPVAPLADSVRNLVESEIGRRPSGRIRLLTHPRYFGYVMNPVSFFYCHDADGELDAIVSEIHNTPWKERHCYVHDAAEARVRCIRGAMRFDFDKVFHVSPFHPMDHRYVWRFSQPGPRLLVHMENVDRRGRPFDATLVMRRRPMTGGSLARLLAGHPFQTGSVVARIYWQALRLRLKGAVFHPHPSTLPEPRP